MMRFLYHDGIQKELSGIEKRFRTVRQGLGSFERLCEVHFHPIHPKQVIAPAKLHRVTQNDSWILWKAELVLPHSGLRPNQWPRIWFAVHGDIVVFVAIASHVDNYRDEDMNRLAIERVSDFL